MSTTTQTRQPAGSPEGGQFGPGIAGAEADSSLLTVDEPAPEDTTFTRRYDTVGEKVEAFQEELKNAVAGLKDDKQWRDYLATMSTFHQYSMNNQILIWIQNPEATHVAGFKTWKTLGRNVQKGEKGLQILRPKIINVDAEPGDPGAFRDKKGQLKRRQVVGFTTTSVFDISQTGGKELPEGRRELSGDPPVGFVDDLEAAIKAEGFTVVYTDTGNANGSANPATKTVTVKSSMSPADQASTLAHELGHIKAGHLDRLDEYHQGHGGKRSEMEVEAEAISYVLCRANGMDIETGGHHDRYISGWGGLNTADDVVEKSAKATATAVKELLSTHAWRNTTAA